MHIGYANAYGSEHTFSASRSLVYVMSLTSKQHVILLHLLHYNINIPGSSQTVSVLCTGEGLRFFAG